MSDILNNIFTTISSFFTLMIVLLNFLPGSSNILRFYENYSFFVDAVFLTMFFISLLMQALDEVLGEETHKISTAIGLLLGVSLSYSFASGMVGNFKNLYDVGLLVMIVLLIPFCIMLVKGLKDKFGEDSSIGMGGILVLAFLPLYWLLYFLKKSGALYRLLRNADKVIFAWIDIFMWVYLLIFLFSIFIFIHKKFSSNFQDVYWFTNGRMLKAKHHIKEKHSSWKEKRDEKKRIKLEEKHYSNISKLIKAIEKNEPQLWQQIKSFVDKAMYYEKEKKLRKYQKEPFKKLSYGIKQLYFLYQLTQKDLRFREYFDDVELELDDYLIEVTDVLNSESDEIDQVIDARYSDPHDIENVLIDFFINLSNLKHYEEEINQFLSDKRNLQWLAISEKDEYKKMVAKCQTLYRNYQKLINDIKELKNHNELEKMQRIDKRYEEYSYFINRLSKLQFAVYYVTSGKRPLRYVLEILYKEHGDRIYLKDYMRNHIKKEFKHYFKNIDKIKHDYDQRINVEKRNKMFNNR